MIDQNQHSHVIPFGNFRISKSITPDSATWESNSKSAYSQHLLRLHILKWIDGSTSSRLEKQCQIGIRGQGCKLTYTVRIK